MDVAVRPLTVSAECWYQWCRSLFSGWSFPAHFYGFSFCLEHLGACQRFVSACFPKRKTIYQAFCPYTIL